jgi:hypothetical protein
MEVQTLQNPSRKPRPALRLVGTKQLPREDWLAVRIAGRTGLPITNPIRTEILPPASRGANFPDRNFFIFCHCVTTLPAHRITATAK